LKNIFWLALFLVPVSSNAQQLPYVNAHAHNDYEHNRPLLDALDNGFISVEADIYLIDGELYVSHNRPVTKDPSRTLKKLYLDPLLERVRKHNGKIYDGYDGFFYLMIDVKTEGQSTCLTLISQLKDYISIISVVNDTVEEKNKPIKIFLSGNRTGKPVESIMDNSIHLISLDGKPDELGKNIPRSLMPVVSDNYWNFLTWKGVGIVNQEEELKLNSFIQKAHAENKKVRLWGGPDTPEIWEYLLDKGVDLINTDKLKEFVEFNN